MSSFSGFISLFFSFDSRKKAGNHTYKTHFTLAVILAFLFTLIPILPFLLTLAPFVNLTVDTFPVSGDGLRSLFFILYKKSFYTVEKHNSPLPSFLSGGQNRNVNKRKEYNMTLSKESGSSYRKIRLTPVFFAWILHSTSYFFIILFPTAFYDRSRMTGKR